MRCALALLWIAVAGCHRGDAPVTRAEPGVRVAQADRGDIVDRVLLTGELRAAASLDLSVPRTTITWELAIRWMAEDGAQVKAGDRVLELDNSAVTADLEKKHLALLEAQMTYESARELAQMETANKANLLAQAEIALAKAKLRAAVPADLLAAHDAQERQLDQKRQEVAVQKAREDLASQTQEAALEDRVKQIDLDKAKHAIDDAQAVIDALDVKAPRAGLVVIGTHPWEERKFHTADTVQPGWAIVSMPDLAAGMVVHSDLSDVDDGRVSVGMTGTCTLDAYPGDPVACTVTHLTPVARGKETSLRRAFAVELALGKAGDQADERMRPGMSVKVELRRSGLAGVVRVPRGALIFGEHGGPTRVRVGGALRDVTIGPCDAQSCAALAGVTAGDTVEIGGGS